MYFDRYGIKKDVCVSNGYKIFFGTDWLDDFEYEAFDKLFQGKTLRLALKDSQSETTTLSSFADAVRLESQLVDVDKLILTESSILYISDDRDIFLFAAQEADIADLIKDITEAGGKTYSTLVKSAVVGPKKEVKEFFDYWAPLNFELEAQE